MLGLIPSYTYDYEQLWSLLINRNKWIINIRYVVTISFVVFIVIAVYVLKLEFSKTQLTALIIIAISVLIYNIFFNFLINASFVKNETDHFNPMHVSLMQILADQITLSILTYYTGGIESPFYIFFIFQMIIGSLMLSGFVVYTIAALTVICFYIASFLEYFSVVPHNHLGFLFKNPIYNNLDYILIFATSFGVTMMVSVFIANSIAHSHYIRGQSLKATYDKLRQAEIVKQKYTMGVVHEIKSPLSTAISFLDLVIEGYTGQVNPQSQEKLVRARSRTSEALHIINDVLNISKLKLLTEIKKEDVDLNELISKLITRKKIQADYLRMGINFYDLSTCKGIVKGDYALLELAFSNLLGNAIKYSNFGGTVEIVMEDARSADEIKIEVCDNGIGIPQNDHDKIFKEFFRAANAKHQNHEGTGLGLSVVKQIVEQHGGTINFQSPSRLADEKGPGTCFKILLKIE